MSQLQTVLDALGKAKRQITHANVAPHGCIDEAIAVVKQMMQAEPVAWMSPGKERIEFSRKDTVYGSHTIPLHPPPQAVPAWQPIESAPKDGTIVLLHGGRTTTAGSYQPNNKKYPWVFLEDCGPDRVNQWEEKGPTHWMPLPAAPAVKGDV
jgi:hypothetical protein